MKGPEEEPMDNRTALALALLIVGFLVADRLYLGWEVPQFAAAQMVRLIDWMAFWR